MRSILKRLSGRHTTAVAYLARGRSVPRAPTRPSTARMPGPSPPAAAGRAVRTCCHRRGHALSFTLSVLRLKPLTATAAAGTARGVHPALTRKQRGALAAAMRRGQQPVFKLTARARDAAANTVIRALRVRSVG